MMRQVFTGASLATIALVASVGYAAPANDAIPQLGGAGMAWNVNFWDRLSL